MQILDSWCAIFQRLVARRASLLRETRLPHRVPSGLFGRDRRRRAFRERSRATERGPALRARHSRLAARGRGRGRRRPRLRRRLRGGFRARRLEHLLARHLPRLHVIHVGGRGRRGALVSKEKQRDQPCGGDEGAARRAPGRASRARAFRRALRLAAGRADDAFGAGDGEARRSETRGASSPGAKASGDAEGARTGVARVRRGASAREREDHACREHLRREMVPYSYSSREGAAVGCGAGCSYLEDAATGEQMNVLRETDMVSGEVDEVHACACARRNASLPFANPRQHPLDSLARKWSHLDLETSSKVRPS